MHLFRFPGGIAGFSEKADGNFGFYDQPAEQVAAAWLGIPAVRRYSLELPRYAAQAHGARVLFVPPRGSEAGLQGSGDALLTAAPGVAVGVFTADCLPVLIAAEGVVTAIHAGWKGTRLGITGRAIEFLRGAYPKAISGVTVFMGPCIGQCCLELGNEVVEEFQTGQPGSLGCFSRGRGWHLDLRALNVIQCLERGIPHTRIKHVNHCTKCLPDNYFSYRYQGGQGGSMFSFIARFPELTLSPAPAGGIGDGKSSGVQVGRVGN